MSPDPDSTVYWFHRNGTTGWLGLESAPIDRILDEARAEPSTDKRDQLYRQLFDHIIPEATYVYTVHANYVSASRANVRNREPLPATLVRYATCGSNARFWTNLGVPLGLPRRRGA